MADLLVVSGVAVGHGIQVLFEQVEPRRPQLAVRRQPLVTVLSADLV